MRRAAALLNLANMDIPRRRTVPAEINLHIVM
jgi:hypothetical protein